MASPLFLLRQYNMSAQDIIERDNQIIFGEFKWPKDFKTKMVASGRKNTPTITKDYYTLECLLFFLKNYDKSHPNYVRAAMDANIQAVRRPDRKNIITYMFGHTETCPCIEYDNSGPLKTLIQMKRSHEHEDEESVAKKTRNEETHVQKPKRKRKRKNKPRNAN